MSPAFLTTPRARIRASASASTPSRPSMPLSHSAYAATESAGARWGSQPSARRALISDRMCRVSPKRYSPVTIPGCVGPVLAHDDVGEFPGGDRLAAPDIEDPSRGAVVREHQHVGVHDVLDVDVVPDRPTILVEDGSPAQQVAQAEDAARTGVRVVHRLPGPLHDAVPERDGRDAVPASQVDGDHFLAELGHAVGVLGIGDPLRRGPHLERTAAPRAGDVPLARRQRAFRPHARCLLAVDRAPVESLAHRRLRRCHHDPGEVEALGHDDLVEQGGRDDVHIGEPREFRQVVLVSGEVVHGVDAAQEVGEQVTVTDVALVEVDLGAQVRRLPVPVYRRRQRVEHHDFVAQRQQPVAGVRADEPGAAGDEDLHFRQCSLSLGHLRDHPSPGLVGARGLLRIFAMIQNTVIEIASALIRDWRMY